MNQYKCLEDYGSPYRRFSDGEARIVIKNCLGRIRNAVLRKVKGIEGVSQR